MILHGNERILEILSQHSLDPCFDIQIQTFKERGQEVYLFTTEACTEGYFKVMLVLVNLHFIVQIWSLCVQKC